VRLFRRVCIFVLSFIILSVSIPLIADTQTGRGHAEPSSSAKGVDMQVSIGYQGTVKEGRWFPVTFVLTNQTDRELAGELVVSVQSPWSSNRVEYAVKAQLPKETPIQLSLALPGVSLTKNNNSIRFYEGTRERGTEIKLGGGKAYLTNTLTPNNTIAIVSRDRDTLNFMPSLNQRGYSITTLPLESSALPEQALMLDALDILVLNDVASDQWGKAQVDAISNWVKGGGTLVLAGGAGYAKTAEAFAQLAPVTIQGTQAFTETTALSSYGGKPLTLAAPLTITSAVPNEGSEVLLQEAGVPLAVQKKIGHGQVIFVAFDPSLDPLASWSGSPIVWSKLLQQQLQILQQGFSSGVRVGGNSFWELQSVADMFPSIKMPHFSILLYLFLGYLLIVAPLLFFLLKRVDRREWAWWIIPTIAVISSIAIFMIGASDKSATLTHTVRSVELTGDGNGTMTGATSVFSPTGGAVKVRFGEALPLVPYSTYDGFGMTGVGDSDAAQTIYMGSGGTEIHWRDVPYWSTRKSYIDRMNVTDVGSLDALVETSGGDTSIEVTNKTLVDLTDVYVLWNTSVYQVGDLAVGASSKVMVSPMQQSSQVGYVDYGSQMFPYSNQRGKDSRERERRLVMGYMNEKLNNGNLVFSGKFMSGTNQPLIVGFTGSSEPAVEVNGKPVKSDTLTMWIQPIKLELVHGSKIGIPMGAVLPFLGASTMSERETRSDGWLGLAKGELEFEYNLPYIQKASYEKLLVEVASMPGQNLVSLMIWNEQESKWEQLTGVGPRWELQAEPFLIQGGTIKLKYVVDSETKTEATMPQIALEGTVKL